MRWVDYILEETMLAEFYVTFKIFWEENYYFKVGQRRLFQSELMFIWGKVGQLFQSGTVTSNRGKMSFQSGA